MKSISNSTQRPQKDTIGLRLQRSARDSADEAVPQSVYDTLRTSFKTDLVSDVNVMETKIDEDDSKGAKVSPSPKRYHHAWLQLRSTTKTGSFFQVH